MTENERQLFSGILPLRQYHPDRPLKQAYGQGRLDVGGSHQFELRLAEPGGLYLLTPDRQNCRIRNWGGIPQNACAEVQVRADFPAQDGYKANQPHSQQDLYQWERGLYHPARRGQPHIAHLGQIEVIGEHPQHSTGPCADVLPQER